MAFSINIFKFSISNLIVVEYLESSILINDLYEFIEFKNSPVSLSEIALL